MDCLEQLVEQRIAELQARLGERVSLDPAYGAAAMARLQPGDADG